jgi:GH25 family lysozyme M1 (1,4-beta-N-acetylmuramidase)
MSWIVEGMINGLDLCSIQDRLPIDPKAIKDAGFEFVYVKASQYSSTKDLRFDSLVDRLRNAGLSVGAYHFCSHDTDPDKQAEFFYKASSGLGSKPGELPPMVDWEFCTPSHYSSNAQKYPLGHPKHCVDWLERMALAVTNLWYPDNDNRLCQRFPVVYSYPNYCGSHQPALGESWIGGYPLCFASYRNDGAIPLKDHVVSHTIPRPWKTWALCQYSGDKGVAVPGISGACDRQVFNGDETAFRKFRGLK